VDYELLKGPVWPGKVDGKRVVVAVEFEYQDSGYYVCQVRPRKHGQTGRAWTGSPPTMTRAQKLVNAHQHYLKEKGRL
jgi:hypothetical protein